MNVKVRREKIRELRAGKGWTQEKLAEKSGVHSRTIQRIENDEIASIQSLVALADALDVEPTILLHKESKIRTNDQQSTPNDYNLDQGELVATSTNEMQQVKEFAKEAERMENWLSYKWIGWPILFIGGFLIVAVLLMTQSNLNRVTIFNVFFPGITIGLLLMLAGKVFIHLSNRAAKEKEALEKFIKTR